MHKIHHRCSLALLIVLSACVLTTAFSQSKSNRQTRTRTAGVVPDPLIFVKQYEPNEKAFSLLIPQGWLTEGGIFFVDAQQVNGWANSIEPKGMYLVKKDQAGTVLIHWLPDYLYCDGRYSATRQMGLMPDGSFYNGMLVTNKPSAEVFLLEFIFPELRPTATEVSVVESTPLNELAARYKKKAALPNLMYEAVKIQLRYTENGVAYQEEMKTVIEDFGAPGQGMWQNHETVLFRAPADQFEEWQRVGDAISTSLHFDAQWQAAAARASAQRMQNARATQNYINRVANEIVDNRRQVHAEIRHEDYLFLSGQEDYINPYTNEVEQRPDGWKYHWQNGNGEIIVTNDQEYDPNHDRNIRRTDYKRSQVRPR